MLRINIEISPDVDGNFTNREDVIIAALTGTAIPGTMEVVAPTPAPVKATPAKAPVKAAPPAKKVEEPVAEEPEPAAPEDEEDEDVLGGTATLADATAKASELVAANKTPLVKAALATVGVRRVSELKGDAIQKFLDAL